MKRRILILCSALCFVFASSLASAQYVTLATQKYDPFGFPRPGNGHTNVPLGTSFYVQIRPASGSIVATSTTMQIKTASQSTWTDLLRANKQFGPNCSGWIKTVSTDLAIYITRSVNLQPNTTYTLRATSQATNGYGFQGGDVQWTFRTEGPATTHSLACNIDFSKSDVPSWQGGFFSGFNKTSFCVSKAWGWMPVYEMMDEVRRQYPKAWSFERDAHPLGSDYYLGNLFRTPPNMVAEQETRRILAMNAKANSVELRVGDFHGHQQYGIASNRPLASDYHVGDQVQIADAKKNATVTVRSVTDGTAPTVEVDLFDTSGWTLTYESTPPTVENPLMPGLFARGGCYLRKFSPHGTAKYYWGRLDSEYDVTGTTYGRRLIFNMRQAPGDHSIDGKEDAPPKDYAQYHQTILDITSHLIERYGDRALSFAWSALNEPDLSPFWRFNWNEAWRYYDYSIDAVLRAFEDHGYDSDEVFVGGLELGGIAGTNLKVHDFYAHCSPTATRSGVMEENAAYADPRLAGKRSRRVENLCAANNGQGSPCDFVVIHAYNSSKLMADKLIAAKQIALDTDPVFFEKLWVNSHESMPDWRPPEDYGARDAFLGNGYLVSWCSDVARRQLARAGQDTRFAYGETILTFWGWVFDGISGMNTPANILSVDSNADGKTDREETVALPILYFAGMLNGMGGNYVVLPEQTVGGYVVSGFLGRTSRDARILLYSHNGADTQTRSGARFGVTLNLTNVPSSFVRVTQCAINADQNSAYRLYETLRKRTSAIYTPAEIDQLREMTTPDATTPVALEVKNGALNLTIPVAPNGVNYIVLTPVGSTAAREWSIYR